MKSFHFLSILTIILCVFSCKPNNTTEDNEKKETIEEVSQTDTVPYELVSFTDSLSAKPGDLEAPTAYFSETWLIPKSDNEDLNDFIATSLKDEMVFEAGALVIEGTKDAFDENKSWFFSEFEEAYQEFNELMGYDSESGMSVVLNDGKWLTIMISSFSYTGGSHGNYGTSYLSLDVENRKRMYLDDIFETGYETVIIPMLEKKVREHFEMEPDTPLNEFLFEDKIAATENFGLLEGGIMFDYPPYELASYAAGEIELFFTYEELADVLLINK